MTIYSTTQRMASYFFKDTALLTKPNNSTVYPPL